MEMETKNVGIILGLSLTDSMSCVNDNSAHLNGTGMDIGLRE
jgi:hypothetical protein